MIQSEAKRARVLAITSGKGGVGKTSSVMNISVELALQKQKVIMVDTDIGLANLHLRFYRNIPEKGTILDILESGRKSDELIQELDGIISKPSESLELYLIPGSCAHDDIFNLDAGMKKEFETVYRKLISDYDFVLFDCGAGITKTNTFFEGITDEIILCTNYEEAAVIGAYAKIKVNMLQSGQKNFSVLVNKATKQEAESCYKTLHKIAREKLNIEVSYLGSVGKDDELFRKCTFKRLPLYLVSPSAEIRKEYFSIGRKLLNSAPAAVQEEKSFMSKIKKLLFPSK